MYLRDKPGYKYVAMDIETDGLDPKVIWCAVFKDLSTGELTECVGIDAVKEYIQNAGSRVVYIGHNALSFDVPVCNRLLGLQMDKRQVVDTLVLSYLYNPKLDGHSLSDYGARFGFPKVEHEDWSQFSQHMLERCRVDVLLTEKVFEALRTKMLIVGFSEKSCEIEHGIREVVDWQESHGFYIDVVGCMNFYNDLRSQEAALERKVLELFPAELKVIKTLKYRRLKDGSEPGAIIRNRAWYPESIVSGSEFLVREWLPFDLGSPQQRLLRLTAIGYVPLNYNKKKKNGKPGSGKVDEDGILAFLEECPEDHKAAVQALAEWLVVNGRANMVGTWLDNINYKDQCIHGRVFTCGAGSRRCTHNKPNTANIPSNEARFGPECRALWTARPGRVLLGGDAKAVQMRQFAHYLGNIEVGMEYVNGDPHQRNADAAEISRKKVKNCFYAMIFGAQDPKLGTTGYGGSGTKYQGRHIREALYETTPGLEQLFLQADKAYQKGSGWMECIDGGWVRCPSPHSALNYWIQSGEAILMKLTLIYVYRGIKKWHLDALQSGFIHDEVQYDCKDLRTAALVGKLFECAIARAGRELGFLVPMAGDCKYGLTWEDTH